MKPNEYYPVADYTHFYPFLQDVLQQYGSLPAVSAYTVSGEQVTHSYRELVQDALRFADFLQRRDLVGKHIAIAGENCYEWLTAFLGAAAAGCVTVLVDIEQSIQTIRQMLETADADVLVASESVAMLLQDDSNALTLVMGENASKWGERQYAHCINQGQADFQPKQPVDPDTAVIAFTSGTTSMPKPVQLSQRGILCNASESVAMVQPTEKVYTSLPFYHTYGLTCAVLGTLMQGKHLGVNGDLKRMQRDFALFDPQTIMAVPLIAEMLYSKLIQAAERAGVSLDPPKRSWFRRQSAGQILPECVALKQKVLGSLELIVCGGAALSDSVAQGLTRFGLVVLQGYGITECSPLVSVNRIGANQMGTVGLVLPSFSLRIREGEIQVRGKSVMQGYYRQPDLTRDAFCDGWFRTGDLGRIDKNGFLSISGRLKNLIVFKNGNKIAPEEVEERVQAIPLVQEVLAYGATVGTDADDVKLAVMVYPNEQETRGMTSYEILNILQEAIDQINNGYPSYQQIQMINLRESEFPKTSSQKIKRQMI